MGTRRSFLQKIGLGAAFSTVLGSAYAQNLEKALSKRQDYSPEALARDEDFWYFVQQAYTVSANIINLNNGGVSPQPKVVQEAFERYNRYANEAPSYYMWRIMDAGREPLRRELASLAGCQPDEIAINRNASEALETVIFGLPLEKGNEVVLTKQDYPNTIHAWKQREKRDGIVLKWINLELPSENAPELVQKFTEQFSAKTKVVQITHIINWSGQVLPAKEIAQAAHQKGIEVLVDAAHSFAQLDFKIPDLEADYFGTSLHKWLCAPFGTGMLYIKKEKIKKIYPLLASQTPDSEDIRKFEALGTRSFATEQAIGQALQFHHMIGSARKSERLFYLKNYWTEKVQQIEKVRIHTSLKRDFSGAIGMVSIEGKKSLELDQFLFNQYKIHAVSVIWENIEGLRVTPHVYTSTSQLDRLVEGIAAFAKQ